MNEQHTPEGIFHIAGGAWVKDDPKADIVPVEEVPVEVVAPVEEPVAEVPVEVAPPVVAPVEAPSFVADIKKDVKTLEADLGSLLG